MPRTPEAITLPGWILHAGFGVLGLLAVAFTQERLFADAAHYLAHVVDSGWFRVEHQRLVLTLAELPSLLATWTGLPMQAILVVHSLGHVALAWLLAWWLLRSGDQDLAYGLLLLQFMGQQWLFFSPQYEIVYGACMAFALLAIWRRKAVPGKGLLLVWLALAVLLLTAHPEHLITYAAVAAIALRGHRWTPTTWGMVLLPVLAVVAAKILFLSGYEQDKFAEGMSGSWRLTDLGYWRGVAGMVPAKYPLVLTLWVATLVASIRSRERVMSAVLLCGTIILAIAVSMVADGSVFTRNTSSAYFPVVTLTLLCASVLWGRSSVRPALVAAVLLIMLADGSIGIVQHGLMLQQRTAMIEAFCVECLSRGSSKCLIGPSDGPALYGTWEWSLPMEAMLISTAGLGRTVNLITPEDIAFDSTYSTLPDEMVLFRRWEPRTVASFSTGHFHELRPGPYRDLRR